MSADDDRPIETLIDSVADGHDIDWAALEAHADPEMLALLAHLKTVAGVADVHRTTTGEEETGPVPAPTGGRGSALGELGRWGHLQLVRKVGEGSYGEVYHARDTWLDHPVALKLLRPELSDHVAPTKLLDEARVLVKVRHPNVVAVHGADLQQGRVGFWMEFVQGQRLDDLVAFHGLLSAEEAAAIGQELCSALAAVHDAGLVHRDVKAQNVIREPKGRVVLMDFGAGQLVADAVGGGGAGTPLYLAPEMFADAPASPQTDIYALGVLLYYLVTAGYPVPARSIEELKEAHARGRQRPLLVARPGLPRGFVNVVEKMLTVDPAERYQTANEALAALKRFTAPASIARKLVAAAGYVGTAVVAITALGLLNTATFNLVMGITSEFSSASALDWFQWGLSSLVAPAVYIAAAAIALTVLIAVAKLLTRISTTAQGLASHMRRAVGESVSDRGLDEPNLRLQVVIGAGTLALGALFLFFWECLAPVTLYVNDASPAALAILNPANEARFDVYGVALDLLLFLYCLASFSVMTAARRQGRPVHRWTKVSAFMVPALALMMWEMPYRLVYHSSMTRVDLGNTRCYELGRRSPNVLLHCPDITAPRNRIVLESDPSVRPRGVVESIFIPLVSSHPTR
jgi:serine/threonine-protein kinase